MSIEQAIYDVLSNDTELSGLLARSSFNTLKPAIYEAWASDETEMPYINLTYTTVEADHWGKRDTTLLVDIFTNSDSTVTEAIKNRVITILDRQKLTLEGDHIARIHSDNETQILEDTSLVLHWEIEFSILYWRKNWIEATE